jgi:hypothetical protein
MATFSKIAKGLRLTGVTGATNDIVSNWLKGLGGSGTTPDMLFAYLRATGLTGSLSDMLSAYVFPAITTKNLIDLSPTSQGFYQFGTPITFASNCEVEFKFILPKSGNYHNAVGAENGESQVIVQSTTSGETPRKLLFIGGGSSLAYTIPNASLDNKLNTLRIVKSGLNVQMILNGSTVNTGSGFDEPVTLRYIGVTKNSSSIFNRFYSGIISDVKLTDVTTPSNSFEFKLNELTQNYELPVDNVFGSEEITNNDYSNGTTGWYSTRGNSVLTVNAGKLRSTTVLAATIGQAQELTGLTIGQAYLLKNATVTASLATETVRIRVAPSAALNETTNEVVGTGSVTFDAIFFATATTMYVGTVCDNIDAGGFVELDAGITARSVTKSLAYNNIGFGDDVRGTYSLSDGAYSGIEKVINGRFADASDWSITGESSISAGRGNIFSSAGANSFLQQQNVITENLQYIFSYEIISADDGDFKVSAVSNSQLNKDIGVNTVVFVSLASSVLLQRANAELTDIVIDNVSIKRYIEVA